MVSLFLLLLEHVFELIVLLEQLFDCLRLVSQVDREQLPLCFQTLRILGHHVSVDSQLPQIRVFLVIILVLLFQLSKALLHLVDNVHVMSHFSVCFLLLACPVVVHPSGKGLMHTLASVSDPERECELLALDVVLHEFFALDVKMAQLGLLLTDDLGQSVDLLTVLDDALFKFRLWNGCVLLLQLLVVALPGGEGRSEVGFEILSSIGSEV